MTTRPIFSRDERRALRRAWDLVLGTALCLGAMALLAALITFDPTDPGVFSDGWGGPKNAMGDPGALAADIVIRLFGVASFGLVGFIALVGWRVLSAKRPALPLSRLFLAPAALAAAAGFASSHAAAAAGGGGLGGLVGDFVFGVLVDGMPFEAIRLSLVLATLATLLLAVLLTLPVFGVRYRSAYGAAAFVALTALRETHALIRPAAPRWPPTAWGADRLRAWVAHYDPFAPNDPLAAAPSAPRPSAAPDDDGGPQDPGPLRPFRGPSGGPRGGPSGGGGGAPRPRSAQDWDPDAIFDDAYGDYADPWEAPPAPSRRRPSSSATAACAGGADALADPREAVDDLERPRERPGRVRRTSPSFSEASFEPPEYPWTASESAQPEYDGDAWAADAWRDDRETAGDASLNADWRADAWDEDADGDRADGYGSPSLSLLRAPDAAANRPLARQELAERADRLQLVLEDYGVKGQLIDAHPGPVVTLFELEPAPGLKAQRVISLADDIARSMSAVSARISTVPGRNVIGIELPNEHRETVLLRESLSDPEFSNAEDPLTLALGKDISGRPINANLARMPHLLIAGTTGSGKSVAINTMLLSLLYRLSPEQVRLILIDPKMLELSVYNDAPHLLAPVVTEPKKAVTALKWTVREMERRYEMMAKLNVRSLESYNRKVAEARARGESFSRTVRTGFDPQTDQPIYETQEIAPEPMPMIVVVVDELADLMMVAGKEIEQCIQRLAQMARASGIHLIVATQRPSVDVITGTIKANFPVRISFQVSSKIDSRTILGEQGAEQLLGRGDMLYNGGAGRLTRIHGPFVSDAEVEAVVDHLRRLGGPDYLTEFDEAEGLSGESGSDASGDQPESLYDKAVSIVIREQRASTSFVQRRLQIGYNRAAGIVERMEADGIVSAPNHVGKREVLAKKAASA